MSPVLDDTLPLTPPPTLRVILDAVEPQERVALTKHLLGGTPATWLSSVLTSTGHPISATTIKDYRRAIRQAGV